ncbi:MAG: hypothetical protein QT08_C0008G0029 [archaeon GW2011_AR17]|nr:MAG: hypothetical protein QT08_C0008G0029 [archaeon GW2011_AR17]MBS3153793.1 hypothetical protein [Candidatus Woesearchaeota archaeon]HIH15181.1 hypothetical protein [Nanoarchaeota archaeon]HIH59447.1 hypothetical protein [Nanoarchaeota archaeon]HIJ04561.1 hypothetical protein [Nanoarchaeota archaeon]
MTKHPASQEKKEPEQSKPGMELPKPTPEQQEKLSKIQKELDTFKEKCLKTRTDITGMSLLPPLQPRPGETINPNEIHIFILIDDAKVEGLAKGDLIVKSTEETTKIAKEINENFKPQVMLITELKEACFDAKYDIIQMVATSALFYDKGLLSALKVAELHKNMAIKKFEKYVVSYIAVGSLFRGDAAPNDIDVAIVIDDTDVKKMSRFELRDKLRAIIINMGYEASQITGVKAQFHIQTYILTDFWESVKDANPVIFTMLRDGVPLYDRGVFMPWKLLLQMGRIKPSPEAIDMNMEVGDKLIDRTKQKLLSVVGEDLFYAVMNPTQAALMLYGIPPPTPKEAVKLMEEIYVKKEKLLEKKYVDILEKIRKTFKDIEHGELKEVSGKDIDKLLTDCKDYLERIKKLFNEIEERTERESIGEIHTTALNLTRDLLLELNVKDISVAKLPELFKKHVCEEEKVPLKFHKDLQEIIKAKKDFDAKKLSKQEVNKVRREAREYIRTILDILDRKRSLELNKSKLFFRYGDNKTGEITFLKDIAFIVKDTNKREEIWIAAIEKDASLQNLKKSDVNEYEKYIKSIKMPHEKILKIQTLESLRDIVGEEVEILWKA